MFFVRHFARPSFAKPVFIFSGVSVAVTTTYYSFKFLSDRTVSLPLSSSRFTPSTLIESTDVSSNTKLLTLSVPPEYLSPDPDVFMPICSIFIKDSDIQVERPYTPLEGIDKHGHMKFWVKKYEHGEVGRWLHSRQVGDSIEIRGPIKTWSRSWEDGNWDEVLMVSGGTGITPFYQLLNSVFGTRDVPFDARFTLLHRSRSLADLPPPCMIQSLTTYSQRFPDKFQFHLFVDSSEPMDDPFESCPSNIQHGQIGKSDIQNALRLVHRIPWWRRLFGPSAHTPHASEKRVLVLVCGPEGMVSAIAGPYGRNYSQGEVGGILKELGLHSRQVWKL